MSAPLKDGLYNIVPTFLMQPSPGVGADPAPSRPGAGSPVVFNGANQVWNVERQPDGTYYLTLEGGGCSIDGPEQAIWVNASIASGDHWHVKPRPESHFYLIMRHDAVRPMAWTLPNAEDKTPVILKTAEEPYNFQEWLFRPVILD